MPQRTFGSVTTRKMRQPPAPSDSAASSSSRPCASMSGINSRAMNGKVMNVVASTMPGSAKMTLKSCSLSQPPNQPRAPNTSTKIRPAITGETANGRSISVSSSPLPRNSYLVIAQAAQVPNTVFNGTRDGGDRQRHAHRRQRIALGQRREIRGDSLGEGLHEYGDERQQQEHCQVEHGHAHQHDAADHATGAGAAGKGVAAPHRRAW